MANITKVASVEVTREFIGRAWVNTVNKEGSALNGVQFMNVQLDNNIKEIVLKPTDKLQLWPNQQRSGKRDADYRLSLIVEAPQTTTDKTRTDAGKTQTALV